jgi:uncharacterized phage protein gp47/JayE
VLVVFNNVLNTMISSIQSGLQAIGKKITDFSSSSVIGVILAAIASAIDELNTAISVAQQQAYLKTATGTNLDNKAADFGITRKQATYAKWTFVATKQSPSTQVITIPAGSVITTVPSPNQPPITFTVDTDTQLPVGSTSVNIPVTCQQAGSIGNIATGTQLLWGSAVPGIDGVQFVDSSTGIPGIDMETDDQLRARALNSFRGLSISTKDWYQSTAESVIGIQSALVVPQGRGPGTVDIYVVGQNNTIPSSSLIAAVQNAIDAGRVITDDAKVFAPSPLQINVSMSIKVIPGYDPNATASAVKTAITNFINNIGIGGGVTGMIYLSQLQSVALGVTGVANAPTPTLPTSDISVSSNQLPQAGVITISAS